MKLTLNILGFDVGYIQIDLPDLGDLIDNDQPPTDTVVKKVSHWWAKRMLK